MFNNRVPNNLLTDEEFERLVSVGFDNLEFFEGDWVDNIGLGCARDSNYIHRWKSMLNGDYDYKVCRCPGHLERVFTGGRMFKITKGGTPIAYVYGHICGQVCCTCETSMTLPAMNFITNFMKGLK
jgi:hypothetical protein